MLPVAVPQHYELQTCAAFGFPARCSNSSDAAYLRSPLFVRALMTSLRTAITDGLLGRKPLLAQDIAADGRAEGLLCLHGQVWALHDAVPEHLPAADVDFIRGVVHPVQQWPNKPLKTDGGAAPIAIAIPQDLALLLSASAQRWLWRVFGNHRSRQRRGSLAHRACPVRKATVDIAEDDKVLTLPEGFSLHDLRPIWRRC